MGEVTDGISLVKCTNTYHNCTQFLQSGVHEVVWFNNVGYVIASALMIAA
jgi:hypothetical protein